MEGSRHERIVIIVAAYVIGFSTAFIAYGINDIIIANNEPTTSVQYRVSDTLAKSPEQKVSVLTNERGLYAVLPSGNRLLTAKRSDQATVVIGSQQTAGLHYAVPIAEVSRNSHYIFYCEQLSAQINECDPFVYSVSEDGLYRVKNGTDQQMSLQNSESVYWDDQNVLHVGDHYAVSAEVPWRLE